ncbi:MAG TPA: ammonia-forming cytochrome c nitrite reductase subunit c552 [Thermoanaerobaculia bacterium]|nr:ammonia-forming cytochrome c nitrite reductase subunit c552 [Thermoanaerobaculia bacterium]
MTETAAAALVTLALAAVTLWLGSLLPPKRWRAPALGVLIGGFAALTWGALAVRDLPVPESEVTERPIAVPDDGYASSSSCRGCHPGEYASWHDSYHRTMTQVASRRAVVADFDGATLHYHGHDYRLFWRGDQPWFETTAAALGLAGSGAAGQAAPVSEAPHVDPAARVEQPVVLTTGSHHLQAYWYATGVGRAVEFFPFIYMIPEGRWAPRESVFLQPTAPIEVELAPISEQDRWQHQRQWNHNCLHCHTTRPSPRFPGPDTRVAELGIACEACHGPGEEHAASMRSPLRRYLEHARAVDAGGSAGGLGQSAADAEESRDEPSAILDPSDLDPRRASQVCGQCHSINYATPEEWQRKLAGGTSFRPGEELTDTHFLCRASQGEEALTRCGNPDLEHQYWSDGMLRVSGREYIGLLDSPCYQRGELTCLSCHEMHQEPHDPRPREAWADDQLGAGMDGNAACTQCHEELEAPAALERHSRHPASSSGSACLDCHMPPTAYGLLKATRSHQISSPTVRESLETGRPNACNQCHLDRSLGWSAGHLGRWFAQPAPELDAVEVAVPASILWALSGDAGQRALMAWSYGWRTALETSDRRWVTPLLVQLLDDPYDAVRLVAARALRTAYPELGELELDALAPLPDRRAAAAEVYARWSALSEEQRREPRTLVDASGGPLVEGDLFLWLWQRRDDRVVILTE